MRGHVAGIHGQGRLSLLATRVFEGLPPVPIERADRTERAIHDGQVTLFLSCHGGAGGTTIATTVGAMLAGEGKRVCILDLDLQFGEVLTALNMRNHCPISTLIQQPGPIAEADLLPRLSRHPTGLHVLSQVGNIDGVGTVDPARLSELLRQVRECFDHVLIDGVRDFNDHALSVMDLADTFVLVATQDVPALRGLLMRLELLKRLHFHRAALHVLINRYSSRATVSLATIETALGVQPSHIVRNDFRTVHRALNDGTPLPELAPHAPVTRDLWAVVHDLYGLEARRPRRLFGSKR